jgi:hypothetical protein
MAKIEGVCREVIDKTEWIAIATAGPEGPHIVATWGDYVRAVGVEDETLTIPVGGMHRTEANLARDNRVELLCGTRQVLGSQGKPGRGCCIAGEAELQTSGPHFDAVRAKFPWARAALVVHVKETRLQL